MALSDLNVAVATGAPGIKIPPGMVAIFRKFFSADPVYPPYLFGAILGENRCICWFFGPFLLKSLNFNDLIFRELLGTSSLY